MGKVNTELAILIVFSMIWIARPISYHELRIRHPIEKTESTSFAFSLEELSLLGNTESTLLLKRINSPIDEIKFISSKKDDNLDITQDKRWAKNPIFVQGLESIRNYPARPNINYLDQVEKRTVRLL